MDSIIFNLNGRKFSLPRKQKYLRKIPEDKEALCDELNSGIPYNVQSHVKNETFQLYLDYWEKETIPEVTSDNIWEFCQLCDEFGLMKDYISSPQFESLFNLSYLANSTQSSNIDKSAIEKQISLNLDHYLTKEDEELSKIDINTLYNIFYNKERKLDDVDKAYDFILNAAENVSQSIFILLGSLDANLFKDKNKMKESFFKKNEHHGFAPLNAEKFIYDLESKLQNYGNFEQKVTQLESDLKASNEKVTQLESDLKSSNEKVTQLESDLKASNEKVTQLESNLKASNEKVIQLESDLKDSNEKVIQLESNLKDSNDKNSQLESDLKTSTLKISQLEANLHDANERNIANQISLYILSNFIKCFIQFHQMFYPISSNVLSNFIKCFIQFHQILYAIPANVLSNFIKFFMQFQQIFYPISTNVLCNFNKYFIQFQQMFYAISINILSNFNKYFI